MRPIISNLMKNLWIIAGALSLAGCFSNPDSTPETNAVAPIAQPQIMATVAPPIAVAPTPVPPIDNSALDANAPTPATSQETNDEKRREVESLRAELDLLQNQRRSVEEQKRQFGQRNPNADANERALGADSQADVRMAQYNSQLDQIDADMSAKQKRIDDLMLGG